MKTIKSLIAANATLAVVLVWTSQASFGQRGHTFRTNQNQGDVMGVGGNSSSANTARTPSMTRPSRFRPAAPSNRGRSIGVAKPQAADETTESQGEGWTRPDRSSSANTRQRGRSIGVATPGGNSTGSASRRNRSSGYSDIRRRSSARTRRPNPAGATSEFF